MYNNANKILFIFLFLFSNTCFTQDGNEEFRVKYRRYGFGLGYNPLLIFNDFKDINLQLEKTDIGSFSSNFLSQSAVLYFYSGFIANSRIGLIWSGGEKNKSSTGNSSFNQEYTYKINILGLSFDYAYPLMKRSSLVLGFIIGKGDQGLIFSQNGNNVMDWNRLWGEFNTHESIQTYRRNLQSSAFLFSPYLSLDYGVCDFLALRAGVGYLSSLKSKIYLDDFYEVQSVPNSLKFNNFYIQFGILVGIFMD